MPGRGSIEGMARSNADDVHSVLNQSAQIGAFLVRPQLAKTKVKDHAYVRERVHANPPNKSLLLAVVVHLHVRRYHQVQNLQLNGTLLIARAVRSDRFESFRTEKSAWPMTTVSRASMIFPPFANTTRDTRCLDRWREIVERKPPLSIYA